MQEIIARIVTAIEAITVAQIGAQGAYAVVGKNDEPSEPYITMSGTSTDLTELEAFMTNELSRLVKEAKQKDGKPLPEGTKPTLYWRLQNKIEITTDTETKRFYIRTRVAVPGADWLGDRVSP